MNGKTGRRRIFCQNLISKITSHTVLFYLKLYRDSNCELSRPTRAEQYKILVEPASTLKTHCEHMRRLTDKPDTVQEFSDNSEQNQGG